jgi:polysaccharide deacetylase 2 family uncharacterized protein YibQ
MKAFAIASTVLTGLLVAVIGVLLLRADPQGGEPFAVVKVDPETRPDAAQRHTIVPDAPGTAAEAEQSPAETAEAESTPERDEPVRGASGAAGTEPGTGPDGAGEAPADAAQSAAAPADGEGDGATGPADIPDDALVENSRYGELPKIAADGRRPSEVYARPADMAAHPGQGEPARIAILINGLGLSQEVTAAAVDELPGPVTLAFGPYGRNLQSWVRRAREAGHEVMLQIPLEPYDYPDNDPGPQTLLTGLSPEENQKRLLWLLARFTGYVGVTNHMGAKFAAAQDAFLPVLEEVHSRGLIYVDDGTSARSVAGEIARELGLGFSSAQVQIDADKSREGIQQALRELENIALEKGFAVGVGGSIPLTIEQVAQWAEGLEDRNIVLIPVSAAAKIPHQS